MDSSAFLSEEKLSSLSAKTGLDEKMDTENDLRGDAGEVPKDSIETAYAVAGERPIVHHDPIHRENKSLTSLTTGAIPAPPVTNTQPETEKSAEKPSVPEKSEEKKSNNKKTNPWRLLAGVGLHNYSTRSGVSPFSSGGMQSSDPSSFPTNPGNDLEAIASPSAGPGFMVGIGRSLGIPGHPRWQWQTGIHYQYQTVQISTGTRRDSAISFEDMAGGFSSNRSNYYYMPGSTIKHTGTQHRLHLQAGVGWYMHRNQKWILEGMFFGGMVLHADYLVPHSTQTGLVPIDKVLRKGYFGLETGIRFQPGQWGLGLYGQTNLSSSVSNPAMRNQYWHGAELRVHYQLPTKK
jgi:hypothetical protein